MPKWFFEFQVDAEEIRRKKLSLKKLPPRREGRWFLGKVLWGGQVFQSFYRPSIFSCQLVHTGCAISEKRTQTGIADHDAVTDHDAVANHNAVADQDSIADEYSVT